MHLAADKYAEAIRLYEETRLSVKEIAEKTGVTAPGLSRYIQRNRRDLLMARKGLDTSEDKKTKIRLRNHGSGQSFLSHKKYKEAIEACDSEQYIEMTISGIAQVFGVNPSGLLNQLRNHYPDLSKRRERRRRELGLADNRHRGARKELKDRYAGAISILEKSEKTLEEVAEESGVSLSGLKRFMLEYRKDIVRDRERRRKEAVGDKTLGTLNGNGVFSSPAPSTSEKYKEALELYKTTKLTLREIASRTGVSIDGLSWHLKRWHKDLQRKT